MNIRDPTAPHMSTFSAKTSILRALQGRLCLLGRIAAARVLQQDAAPTFSASALSPLASNTVAHTTPARLCTTAQAHSPSLELKCSHLSLPGSSSRMDRAVVFLVLGMQMGCVGFTRRCAPELLHALPRIVQPHAQSWASAISPLARDPALHHAAMPLRPMRLA